MLLKKPRLKRKRLEELEQSRFIQWVNNYFQPEYAQLIFAVPNGGSRSKKEVVGRDGKKRMISIEGKRLKDQGVRRGVPDVPVCIPSQGYHGLFIEFKKPDGGVTSPEQKMFMKTAEYLGYKCILVTSYMEAKIKLLEYLGDSIGKFVMHV